MTRNGVSGRVRSAIPAWMQRRWGSIAAAAAVLAALLGFISDIQGLIFGSSMSQAEAEMLADRVAVRMDSSARADQGDTVALALDSLARDGGRREHQALRQLDNGEDEAALDALQGSTARLERRSPEEAASRYVQLGIIAEGIDTRRAIEFYESALALDPGRLQAANRLGAALRRTGAPDRARQLHQDALTLAREQGRTAEEIDALAGLASLDVNAGDFAAADARYTEALELADSMGDLRASANMVGNRGYVAQGRGDSEAARSYYTRALALFESADDRVGAALARSNLANFQRENGELDAAADNYRLALAALEQADRRALGGLVLQNLGATAEARGDPDAADRFYRRALERAREFEYAAYIASSARRSGWIALGRDDPAEAITMGEEALAADIRLGDLAGEADTRVLLTGANGLAGDHAAARTHAARAFEIFNSVEPPLDTVGYLHSALGLMAYRDGNSDASRTHSEQASEAYASAGMLAETGEQERRLATLAGNRGDREATCQHLAQALEIYRALGDTAMRETVADRLADEGCTQRG